MSSKQGNGNSDQAEEIGRKLKGRQLGDEFKAALAFALAFARLVPVANRFVKRDGRIQNDDSVLSFTEEQLMNPWVKNYQVRWLEGCVEKPLSTFRLTLLLVTCAP